MVVIECSNANGGTTITDVETLFFFFFLNTFSFNKKPEANPTNHNQEFKMFQKLCCKNNLS